MKDAGRGVHSWNHVPCETAPAGNDCDTDIFDMPARRPVLENPATRPMRGKLYLYYAI